MPKKRESRGRRKGDKGKSKMIQCDNCGRLVPEDKAICVTRNYSPVDPQLAAELEKKGAIIPRYPRKDIFQYLLKPFLHSSNLT